MLLHYITFTLRIFSKYVRYTSISVLSLTLGMTSALLLFLFAQAELSYDTEWEKSDVLYRTSVHFMVNHGGEGWHEHSNRESPNVLAETLKKAYPNIILNTFRLHEIGGLIKTVGSKFLQHNIVLTDPSILEMLEFKTLAGDITLAFESPKNMALSRTMAMRFFGEEFPIGKTLRLESKFGDFEYNIVGIYDDFPHDTVIWVGTMALLDDTMLQQIKPNYDSWYNYESITFFETVQNFDLEEFNKTLRAFTDKYSNLPNSQGVNTAYDDKIRLGASSVKDLHFGPGTWNQNSIQYIYSLIAIGCMLLLLATVNFTNLTTTINIARSREVVLRKILGASRYQLSLQFFAETIFLVFISLLFSLALLEIISPYSGQLFQHSISFDYSKLSNYRVLIYCAIAVLLLGNILPVYYASSVRPSHILGGEQRNTSHIPSYVRKFLVFFQFFSSLSLIILSCVIYLQSVYGIKQGRNFDFSNNIIISSNTLSPKDATTALFDKIQKAPYTINSTYIFSGLFFHNGQYGKFSHNDKIQSNSFTLPSEDTSEKLFLDSFTLPFYNVSENFLETFDIPLLAGRTFNIHRTTDRLPKHGEALPPAQQPPIGIIINLFAARTLGFTDPHSAIGNVLRFSGDNRYQGLVKIIGVIPDVGLHSNTSETLPMVYLFTPDRVEEKDSYRNLVIRHAGNSDQITQAIHETQLSLGTGFNQANSMDTELAAHTYNERMTIYVLLVAAIIVLNMACLGLFGLVSFNVHKRIKEIGIRKVLGASSKDIMLLFIWQFSKPLGVTSLLACTLSCSAAIYWLQTFYYRMSFGWLFPICLIVTCLMFVLIWSTICLTTYHTARRKPVEALRCE